MTGEAEKDKPGQERNQERTFLREDECWRAAQATAGFLPLRRARGGGGQLRQSKARAVDKGRGRVKVNKNREAPYTGVL